MYNNGNYGQYPYGLRQEVIRVNGRNGAEAYQMPPNSSVLLLDESAPVVWLKTTDGASYPTVNGYVITPLKERNTTDALTELEERIARLEESVNANKSDVARTKSAKSDRQQQQQQ